MGKSVSDQRWDPSADRFMLASMSGLRAFWARAWLAGSACCSSRGFTSAMITMRTSDSSAAHRAVGAIQSSWSSEASSKKAGCAPVVDSWMIG